MPKTQRTAEQQREILRLRSKIFRERYKANGPTVIKTEKLCGKCVTTKPFKIRTKIRLLMRGLRKSAPTEILLGCKIAELRTWLEIHWLPGMSWDNYGLRGWHIDHKKPVASFDLSKSEDQRACFHHTNLQPLWAKDNISKSDKLT